jgi:serine/threonine protein kinase
VRRGFQTILARHVTPVESVAPPAIGSMIAGRYELVRLLGQGGMGAVYEAHHTLMDRAYAIKLLLGRGAQSAQAVGRFLREARAASRLEHPFIVRVFDVGRDGSHEPLYIIQELLRGEDLRQRLDREGRLHLRGALAALTPIHAALAVGNSRG